MSYLASSLPDLARRTNRLQSTTSTAAAASMPSIQNFKLNLRTSLKQSAAQRRWAEVTAAVTAGNIASATAALAASVRWAKSI